LSQQEKSCADCKWREGTRCKFALPAWLWDALAAVPWDGDPPRLNRIRTSRPHTDCDTWEPHP
jgi:hypothetical protein